MPTVILVRHGRTPANADGVLAGRSPGVHLDPTGREQAQEAGRRLVALPLAALVASPLARTIETARLLAQQWPSTPDLERDRGLIECGYGTWTGRSLKDLAKDPLWRTVQSHPSAVRFPEGEAMTEMQSRAVAAVRARDQAVADSAGSDALWVAVSHGDVIKAVLADAYGMHLDAFQRITVGPGSVSVVRYTDSRPYVVHVNDTGSDLSRLRPPPRRRRRRRGTDDAAVGGGA